MAEKKIKKSQNFLQLSGVLLETNIEIKQNEKVKIRNFKGDGSEKEITCDIAKKKEFKNPSFLIECSPKDEGGNVIGTYQLGVDFAQIGFGVASKEFDKDGKVVDSGNFKGIETVLNDYVTRKEASELTAKNKKIAEKEANGAEVVAGRDYEIVEPTKVFIKSGFLSPNEYATEQGEFKVNLPTITTYNVTSTGVPDEDISEGSITGYIKSIIDEVFNDEETGRLKVEFYFFDSKGEAYPVNFTVEKDLADDFREFYENGTSCKIYYDILTRQIGAKKVSSNNGFGRRDTNTVSGYSATEYSIFKGDESFEEENELYIEPKEFNKAMESRAITIEQKIKTKKDGSKGGNSNSGSKSKPSGGGLGNRNSKVDDGFMNIPDGDDSELLPF